MCGGKRVVSYLSPRALVRRSALPLAPARSGLYRAFIDAAAPDIAVEEGRAPPGAIT